MSSSEFKIDLKFFSTGIDEVISGMQKLKVATADTMSGQTALTKSTDSLGKSTEKAKPSLLQLGTSFGTVTAAGWSLYNSYDNLEKIKASSEKSNTRVKTSLLAVQDAEQKLAAAIAKYGEGSKEAAEATAELAVKKEQLANASEIAAIKADDVREAYAQFATTLPTMILSVVNAGVSFNKMVTEMGGIHKIAPQVTSALQAVGGGFKAILMNPIGLVLTAIATVFVLLATNAFGFRDAVNAVGKAIGDALPFLQPFLELIGGAANWFLNLINPVQEASAQLDTLGTSAGGAGTAMEETQVQVEGLGGALIDQGDVVTDVIGFYDSLVAKDAEMAAAYDAFKKAQITGNTEILDSYNLTGEDITKFKEQYEKDMEDAQKAAEKAAEESYNAWKKARDDINTEIKGGFGVLESHFDKVVSELVSAAEEGMNEFETVMEKHGLSATHPATYAAIIKFMVDSGEAEDDYITFAEFVLANVETLNTTTTKEFGEMMTSWAAEMEDSRPEFADEAYNLAAEMTADFDKYLKEGKSPGQAFLLAVKENLSEDEAKKIGQYFPGVILDTTAATFTADTKVPAATDSLTAKIDAALGIGLSKLPTTTGTEVGKIGPAITSQAPTIERDAGTLTEGVNSIFQTDFAEIPKITDTEFQKVPQAITTSGNKANTESQNMATKVTTNVKKIGTETTATADVVTNDLGTTIPDAAKKMQTDSKPEMDKMVTNTKQFATDMKAELSPIAQLFKDVLKLPDVPQSRYGSTSMADQGQKPPLTQNAELADYTIEKAALDEYVKYVAQKTTEISAMFLNMKTSISNTMTQLQTILGAFASTAMTTIATAVSTQTTLMSAHFLTMKTSVTTSITGLQAALTAFVTAIGAVATSVGQQTTTMSAHFLTMSTSIAGTVAKIQQTITTMVGAAQKMASDTASHTTSVSGSFLAMSSSMASSISKAISEMTKFVSSLKSVSSQAATAKKDVDALAKSINALKDKKITVTVGLSGPGVAYLQHGGAFITGLPAGQHGYAGIVSGPGRVGGVRVGEGFRPELVTVTPLTRGTGNHYGATMGGGFGSPGGRGGGEVVNNITVVLDGRVIQRFVEKTALAGIGVQI